MKGNMMPRFDEYLDGLNMDELPETLIDDLRNAYEEDMSIPQAKIDELQAKEQAAMQTIADLKSRNYDLLEQIPRDGGDAPVDQSDEPDQPTMDDVINRLKGSR